MAQLSSSTIYGKLKATTEIITDKITAESVSTDDATINTSLTDASGVQHTGELAESSDVSSIQSSSDVDHNQTTNRTHSGDDLSPSSVSASTSLTIPEVTDDTNTNGNLWIRSDL